MVDRITLWWHEVVPIGGVLPAEIWRRRHRFLTGVLWLHIPVLFVFGVIMGVGLPHAAIDVSPLLGCALLASWGGLRRSTRAAVTSLGLFAAAAVLVHLSHGAIEAHFHFFVIVGLVTLYQDWVPFLVGIAFTVLEHGVVGVLAPNAVYNHGAAQQNPWLWALIHGGFLAAASLAPLASWSLNETIALKDPLTGLDNRSLLLRRLDTAMQRWQRDGAACNVLLIDLDGFKAVNDRRGHAAGDTLLVAVAHRIRAVARLGDTVARLGGDEFALVLPGVSPERAVAIGHRLVADLAAPIDVDGVTVHVGASVGLSSAGPGVEDTTDMLRNADLAMYLAKAQGRNRLVSFDSQMGDEARQRAALEVDLAHAVPRGQLVLHYQPTVVLDSERISGVEALVRWQHPTRGLLAPAEFIPVAERSDVICEIGRFVLDRACHQGRAWQEELALAELTMAVNVSARHLAGPDFVTDVLGALHGSGFDAHGLVLEITESVLVPDMSGSVAKLAELRSHGVRVAVDDFGTGYSSLSYLRHLPVDIIKIDRTFVASLDPERPEAGLAQAVVRIGETLSLQVVAEGVEREEERVALLQLRCHHAQGFLFARPLPADQVTVLLGARRAASELVAEGGPLALVGH